MNQKYVLCLVVCVAACAAGHAQEPDNLTDSVLAVLEDHLRTLGGNTLLVFPFTYSDGIKSIEGALISERMVTKITERGIARVVDRALLDKVMEEQKLSTTGLVDPTTAVEVGRLLGARGILSGTVTDLGEKLEVHVRLLAIESGEVVASHKQDTRKTIKTFISPLWSQIERIKKESESFGVRLWADKGNEATAIPGYRIGDFITLHFKAERDCYVTIFDFTTSGSVHVLFPNSFMPTNRIRAARTYTFPDAQAGFKIRVKGPAGVERLKLFATTKDIPLFEEDYSQESFRSVTRENYSVTRDLEAVIDSLGKNTWAESHLELRIEQILRSGAKAKEKPAEEPDSKADDSHAGD